MLAPNVPNVLTMLRILLVPVVVVALLGETPHGDLVAAVVFAFASATDWVDGWLARSRDSVTTFGKLMDPVADKLLVIAALVVLVSLDRLAAWVAMVIIARELAVTMSRVAASGQGTQTFMTISGVAGRNRVSLPRRPRGSYRLKLVPITGGRRGTAVSLRLSLR